MNFIHSLKIVLIFLLVLLKAFIQEFYNLIMIYYLNEYYLLQKSLINQGFIYCCLNSPYYYQYFIAIIIASFKFIVIQLLLTYLYIIFKFITELFKYYLNQHSFDYHQTKYFSISVNQNLV